MNKTININLGGIFFHIDEIAYAKLKRYLDAISRSLNDDPQGKEEILSDIEQRISELLSEKISDERQVINESNIDEVIAIMGQPEDYAYDEELFNEPQTKKTIHKKLYRDGKDKILGGVSSGLGYYFGIDTAWVRIIWILITLIFGTGILVYIVLWIILPEANTTAEELEMKGEPVNIDNIERSIKEEYAKIEDKVRNADYTKVKSGLQDFIDTIGKILLVILQVIGKFIGVLILIIAAAVLIGMVIGLFSWGSFEILGFGEQMVQVPAFFEGSILPRWLLILFFFTAVIIPFIFLFILGLNVLSKDKKSLGTTANLSMLGIWLVSLFGLAFAGIEHNSRFSTHASISENYEFEVAAQDTLKIVMHGNDKIANRKSLYRSSNLETVEDSLGNEKLYSSYIFLDVRRSSSEKVIVKILKSARAYNKKTAKASAKEISYEFKNNNTTLDLNAFFLTNPDLKNNRPKIDVIIYVPDDLYVFFDHTSQSFLYNVKNVQDIYDSDMANHYFKMNTSGFECTDCNDKKEETTGDVNLKINKEGVKLSIKDGTDKVNVNIDENGIEVK
jgi:phage shock protein PspC (stress-responsive transcriptional regulator)